jgi:hypothetical protein
MLSVSFRETLLHTVNLTTESRNRDLNQAALLFSSDVIWNFICNFHSSSDITSLHKEYMHFFTYWNVKYYIKYVYWFYLAYNPKIKLFLQAVLHHGL